MPTPSSTKPIVIDANIVFAAFIKDGATREIILDRGLDLRSPPWLWEEVAARYDWILEKSKSPETLLDQLLRQVRARITDVPEDLILMHKEEALKRTGKAGKKDAPYIAAVLAVDGVLWTHDGPLQRAGQVETITTKQLLALD